MPSHQRVSELITMYDDSAASVAHLLCDRHPADAVAFTILDADLQRTDLTYGELRARSEQCAAALAGLGVRAGDRVATLMGKSVDHLVTVLGAWRLGAVHVPLFTAFAAPAVAHRLTDAGVKVVVTDEGQRHKIGAGPWRTVVAGPELAALLAPQEPGGTAVAVGGAAPLLQLYTSGTTGTPKAVVMPVRALAAVHAYMELGLDVRPDDVFWNAADPGWAYGHYYGLLGPLALGIRSTWLTSGFDAELTWRVLAELQVTNFAAAPTVYRALRQHSPAGRPGVRLRCASAAGEPLTPEVNEWAPAALGCVVHDHYGQTETGMLVNNHHHPDLAQPVVPGVMGTVMPGWRTAVLSEDSLEPVAAGTTGRLAVDTNASPLAWFAGYEGAPDKTAEKLPGDGRWYLTGDAAWIDADGRHHFVARDDDVIIMAGYRIGPFDIESVLLGHPDVAEAAVVAAPDAVRGEVLEAFVVLTPGTQLTDALTNELQQRVKSEYAAHAYPRAVHAVEQLPKTPSGKIQRFVLREQRRLETAGAER